VQSHRSHSPAFTSTKEVVASQGLFLLLRSANPHAEIGGKPVRNENEMLGQTQTAEAVASSTLAGLDMSQPAQNSDSLERDVHQENSERTPLGAFTKVAKIAGQASAIVGAVAAILSLIGGVWIAAAAYMVPGGGTALSSSSLTGLISLVAFGGVWFALMAGGTLGSSGYCYGIMFRGSDKIRAQEKPVARRFLPELVLFAGNTVAVVIVFFFMSRAQFGLQHLWPSAGVVLLICAPTLSAAILHATVDPKLKRSPLGGCRCCL
jgi:type IV secretory pathway TrbD component